MSTHVPGFQSFFVFLHHFVLATLATSSIGVNNMTLLQTFRKFIIKVIFESLAGPDYGLESLLGIGRFNV